MRARKRKKTQGEKMIFAVIGGGGREHALVWKLSQSPLVKKIYAFTQNPGIANLAEISSINPLDFKALAQFLKKNKVDYTIVGPEDPLANGIVDFLEKEGLKAFGPSKAAAQMEASKDFAKKIMLQGKVPTASYQSFSQIEPALNYLKTQNQFPIVIKADGLCAGKGVLIAQSFDEGADFIKSALEGESFGQSGAKIIIEEFLVGEEISVFALTDGKSIKYLSVAQDHKRVFEGDKGPNTGGMGAYASTSLASPRLMEHVHNTIIIPTLETLKSQGVVYKGVLYAGLILTSKGAQVLEYNCRFGDPETQVLLPLLETDLALLVKAVVEEELEGLEISLSPKKAVCFVAASGGYPGDYTKNKVIHGLDKTSSLVFHAGTKKEKDNILTNGGRVLNIVVLANTIKEARKKALLELEKISFEAMHYRKDIALKELTRPLVSVIMGSESDLPILKETLKIFEELNIPFTVHTLSAHRTPHEVIELAKSWEEKGIKVAIAAAGMAAHLPGIISGCTDIPVIGVPLAASFNGLDALYSMVQMPGGVPVATVSVGKAGAKNAAILALRILALSNPEIAKKLKTYKEQQTMAVLQKNQLLQEIGYKEYLERKGL